MKELKNAECVVVLQKTDDDGDRMLVQIPVKKEDKKETFEKQLKLVLSTDSGHAVH
jgi:hypothetical protein